MAEGRRKQEWHRTAVQTCLIANTWRGKKGALKLENFPYCSKQAAVRMATPAELRSFASNFFKR